MSLEETLKAKLDRGEISQEEYDNLIKKFGDLDLLGSRVSSESERFSRKSRSDQSWSIHGAAVREGGDITEDVKVNGRLTVNGNLKCPSMKISGSTTIKGDLTVVDVFKVSGATTVEGTGKFGGISKVSGKLNVDSNAYFTNGLKISGKADFGNEFVIGEELKISGKLNAASVESKSLISLSGAMVVDQNVVAKEFISSGGKSDIGGNLEAIIIEIAKKYRERQRFDDDPIMDTDDINSLPDLGKFISNIVTKVLPGVIGGGHGVWGQPSIFHVRGSMKGTKIDISYTNVEGDVEGDDVIIGPSVTIGGSIRYRNSISLPDEHSYNVVKVD